MTDNRIITEWIGCNIDYCKAEDIAERIGASIITYCNDDQIETWARGTAEQIATIVEEIEG